MIFIKEYLSEIFNNYKFKWMIFVSFLISIVVAYIDILNIPTELILEGKLFIIILFLLAVIILFFDYNFFNKKLNSFDQKLFVSLLSILSLFCYVVFFDYKLYKAIVLSALALFILVLQIIRIYIINNSAVECNEFNTIDLKEFIYGNPIIDKSKGVFLEENEVDYDLLDKGNVINQLFNSIAKCNPRNSFTIGLNGKWGSGKTTIVNNVFRIMKANEIYDNYIVINFDPWQYGDEKAILKGLLLEISNTLEITKEYDDVNEMINYIIDSVFSSKSSIVSDTLKIIVGVLNPKNDLNDIISQKLKKEKKKMLLIIDNLDRIDNDKAVFLVKSIQTIAKYKNTIYLLLYDEKIINARLNEVFNTSSNYMDKIVQLKIDIGEVDSSVINNLKDKICDSLIKYELVPSDFKLNDNCEFKSLRELKRIFNSILSSNSTFNYLNHDDYITLEYIKNNNIDLYYQIFNKKNFFIVDDRIYFEDLYTLNRKKLNEETNTYFDKLFSIDENNLYKKTLMKMFPTVKNYLEGKEPFQEFRDPSEYKQGIVNNRIFNARYFELYFTNNENQFIILNKNVASIVELFNSTENDTKISENFKRIITQFDFVEQKVFMEILELNLDKIDQKERLKVAICLYKNHKCLKSGSFFVGLDSLSRCAIIISKILIDLSEEDFLTFIKMLKTDYSYLYFLNDIKYWLEHSEKKNQQRLELYVKVYEEICDNIYKKKINLFNKKYYSKGNIWALYHYDKESMNQYILENINKNNVYKLINDLVSNSVGTRGYGYHIVKRSVDALCPNLDIDNLISDHKLKLSNDEEFLKKIYELYKTNINDMDNEIYLDEYKDIVDL